VVSKVAKSQSGRFGCQNIFKKFSAGLQIPVDNATPCIRLQSGEVKMFQVPKKRPDKQEKQMDDWMRLILINWVLISFVMFYSILIGLICGSLVAVVADGVLGMVGIRGKIFDVFPFSPAATALIAGIIAFLFLATFRTIRYNCQTGGYTLPLTPRILRLLARRAGVCIGFLLISALALRLLGAS
jgi:hypothetical protein